MCHEARPALGGQQCRRVGTSSRTSGLGDLQAYRGFGSSQTAFLTEGWICFPKSLILAMYQSKPKDLVGRYAKPYRALILEI